MSSAPVPVHSVQPVLQLWSFWAELVDTQQDGLVVSEQRLHLLPGSRLKYKHQHWNLSPDLLPSGLNLTLRSLALALRSSRSTARPDRCLVSSLGTALRNQEAISSRSLFRCRSSQHPLTPGREQTLLRTHTDVLNLYSQGRFRNPDAKSAKTEY